MTRPPVDHSWRRGRDSNPRYGFHRTHAFQACDLNHSSTSPDAGFYRLSDVTERAAALGRGLAGAVRCWHSGYGLRRGCIGAAGMKVDDASAADGHPAMQPGLEAVSERVADGEARSEERR